MTMGSNVRNRKGPLLVAAGWMVLALPVVDAAAGRAQATDVASPSFAAATIKPGRNLPGVGIGFLPGDRFMARDATVKDLIGAAYGLKFGSDDQIVGGPSWVRSAKFDIEGKAEEPLPAEVQKTPNHDRLMLQAMLADRFKLKVHHETRELPVYALIVAKSGAKLTPSVAAATLPGDGPPTYAFGAKLPTPPKGRGMSQGIGDMHAQHVTMGWLAGYLQFQPEIEGRTVIDKTDIAGEFDVTLQWIPEGKETRVADSGLPPASATWPPLFVALQEELGLKLESIKGPVDTIVIDSVEMPSQN
jgi:uncharacterized protein (TIGR03435 family)